MANTGNHRMTSLSTFLLHKTYKCSICVLCFLHDAQTTEFLGTRLEWILQVACTGRKKQRPVNHGELLESAGRGSQPFRLSHRVMRQSQVSSSLPPSLPSCMHNVERRSSRRRRSKYFEWRCHSVSVLLCTIAPSHYSSRVVSSSATRWLKGRADNEEEDMLLLELL